MWGAVNMASLGAFATWIKTTYCRARRRDHATDTFNVFSVDVFSAGACDAQTVACRCVFDCYGARFSLPTASAAGQTAIERTGQE